MGSDTRDRIVRAAALLFHEQGFEATSVSAVLDAADVNSGSLYHFFAGKTSLLEAVLARHIELLRPSLLEPAELAGSDPVVRVFALIDHYRRNLAASGATLGCPVGQLALEVGHQSADARTLVARYFSEWIGGVAGWFRREPDRTPPGIDPDAVAGHVLAVVEGALIQAIAAGTVEPFDGAVNVLRSSFDQLDTARRAMPAAVPGHPTEVPDVGGPDEEEDDATAWRAW
jgi:AcrR family transcriptional regulator